MIFMSNYIIFADEQGSPFLAHYGIKGQKWGIRRYQNYDGTYTKKGLERYNKSAERYDKAKQTLSVAKTGAKEGWVAKSVVKEARKDLSSARKELNKNYKQLKYDKRADRGKELYKSGKTITNSVIGSSLKNYGIAIGGTVAATIAANSGTKYSNLASATIVAGAYAAQAAVLAKNYRDARDLRAYYAHR